VKLGKDWQITTDSMNIILKRRRRVPAKGGKPAHDRWINVGYYGNLRAALNDILDKKIIASGIKDLQTVLKAIEEVRSLIKKVPEKALDEDRRGLKKKAGAQHG